MLGTESLPLSHRQVAALAEVIVSHCPQTPDWSTRRVPRRTGAVRTAALGLTAEEVQELGLQICPDRRLQLRPEDPRLSDHGIHRLQSVVGLADQFLVEVLVRA